MIKKEIEDALNAQVNAEFWSAYLYLSMSCYCTAAGRSGMANWFHVQYQEELAHAEALLNFVQARGGRVALQPIDGVPQNWDSIKDVFVSTLEHERKVTELINNLYALAEQNHDYATRQKLNNFIAEQVEEEETVQGIIDNIDLIGDNGTGLYQLDLELAKRTFVAPTTL
ncbi:MAG: ferritin [Duncaniella sp.]|nr:ferritin [Duncaniella sp.]MDE5735129.1 ferritin [Duncaniella sp.]